MVTSRAVPQQTAQIFSALAGQKRPGLRFWQSGQDTRDPLEGQQKQRISRHEDFVVEAARGNDQQERAHKEQRGGV
jgi:hypothetical protein